MTRHAGGRGRPRPSSSPRRPSARRLRAIARDAFGYGTLRPGQEEALREILAGRDALVVMPTGAGKSAVYQLAGLLTPGLTLVVSPLLALQRDQVESRESEEAGGAVEINSAVSESARRAAFERAGEGDVEFVLLAPEQLANEETLARLRDAGPTLLVVDEAHCVSEWGHDFRPDYLRLRSVREALGTPQAIALTATASGPVREEIVERLGLDDPAVVVRGFDRPNIRLEVQRLDDGAAKRKALLARVEELPPPGIVYAATRRRAEEIAGELSERGLRAAAYHAGLAAGRREEAQQAFMDDELDVIVATTAFGMGVDKPNVRFVAHAEVPESVDALYQELGRAGRDGEPATSVVFYRPEDLGLRRFFASGSGPDAEELQAVAETVAEHGSPVPLPELAEETGLPESRLVVAVHRLEDEGALEVLSDGRVRPAADVEELEDAAREAAEAGARRAELDRSRVEMVRAYAETRGCRRQFLLNYFGEPYEPPCGACDSCERGLPGEPTEEPWALGDTVTHDEWGDGLVQRYEGDGVVVLFPDGYRTVSVPLALEKGLLRAAG